MLPNLWPRWRVAGRVAAITTRNRRSRSLNLRAMSGVLTLPVPMMRATVSGAWSRFSTLPRRYPLSKWRYSIQSSSSRLPLSFCSPLVRQQPSTFVDHPSSERQLCPVFAPAPDGVRMRRARLLRVSALALCLEVAESRESSALSEVLATQSQSLVLDEPQGASPGLWRHSNRVLPPVEKP